MSQWVHKQSNDPQVVVIKAAGFEEGQKPEGPDAITEATSKGRNVHVICDALRHTLEESGVETEVIRFNDYERIRRLSKNASVRMIVFAGPAYSSRFPRQLKDVVPKLQSHILEQHIVCTSMTTCRFMDSGGWTVQSFNNALQQSGVQTMDGLVIHHEYEDKDWERNVRTFAAKIQERL